LSSESLQSPHDDAKVLQLQVKQIDFAQLKSKRSGNDGLSNRVNIALKPSSVMEVDIYDKGDSGVLTMGKKSPMSGLHSVATSKFNQFGGNSTRKMQELLPSEVSASSNSLNTQQQSVNQSNLMSKRNMLIK